MVMVEDLGPLKKVGLLLGYFLLRHFLLAVDYLNQCILQKK